MITDNPFKERDIDSVIDILHTTLNTTKETVRIGGEDKPAMLAVNYSTIRNNLKDYCDKASDLYETVIVTRKDEKMLSL